MSYLKTDEVEVMVEAEGDWQRAVILVRSHLLCSQFNSIEQMPTDIFTDPKAMT